MSSRVTETVSGAVLSPMAKRGRAELISFSATDRSSDMAVFPTVAKIAGKSSPNPDEELLARKRVFCSGKRDSMIEDTGFDSTERR